MILEISASGFSENTSGGGERYFSELSNFLSARGLAVSWSSNPVRKISNMLSVGQNGSLHFNIAGILQNTNPIPSIKTIVNIRDFLNRFEDEINIVHLHNFRTLSNLVWYNFLRQKYYKKKFKFILSDHGSMFVPFPKTLLNLYDYYAPVSELSNTYLQSIRRRPYKIIRSFVTDSMFESYDNTSFESRDIDILYVGRLAPWKGIEKIILTTKGLKERGMKDINVKLIGKPIGASYLSYLHSLILKYNLKNNLELVYNANDRDLVRFYNRTKVFMHMSSSIDSFGKKHNFPELSSSSTIEALSFGNALIGSKSIPALEEARIGGGSVVAVDPHDIGKVIEKTSEILENRDFWSEISKKNRKYIGSNRLLSIVGMQFIEFTQEISDGVI